MPELPVISRSRCTSVLDRIGYRVARTKASHVRMSCPGRRAVTVPKHQELDRGTPKGILRTASLTVEEFVKLM
jgi:predicted RNA binding protein YcfA (HicA-like mRNA interferase family)